MLDPTTTFQELRPRMFGLAYHMLGSLSEAEDVVQDAYLRWHGVDHASVQQPSAYLLRTVTHLCLDATDLAYRKRTEYIGEWLPDPLIQVEDASASIEHEEVLSLAILRLLEQLNPVERAVFVLRQVFDYSYREISDMIGKNEAACRQIEHRARQKVSQQHERQSSDHAAHQLLLWRFLNAVRDGDLAPLLQLLADDAVLYSDGGGKAKAALKPVLGNERIARFFLGITSKLPPEFSFEVITANKTVGIINKLGGQPFQVMTFIMEHDQIVEVQIVMNPDKLAAMFKH